MPVSALTHSCFTTKESIPLPCCVMMKASSGKDKGEGEGVPSSPRHNWSTTRAGEYVIHSEGEIDGTLVGFVLGALLGEPEGWPDGCKDGTPEGEVEGGSVVGSSDGSTDGSADGFTEGSIVGDELGSSLGTAHCIGSSQLTRKETCSCNIG
jgi:hypothetical protein